MYRLLVADDEELIRQGLLARLDFLGFAFESILEAASGLEALMVIEKNKIDIVICDIQMPDMDGLTFLEKTRERFPRIKFILLTGYAEFAYAEKAITLGVQAYLLKPISNTELKEALEKTLKLMEEEAQIKNIVYSKERLIREQAGYLLEKELNRLVTCETEDTVGQYPFLKERYPAVLGENEVRESRRKQLLFGIICIDTNSYQNSSFSEKDRELLRFSVKNVFSEIASTCEKVIVNNMVKSNELYVFFIAGRQGNLRDEVERIFLKLQSVFEKKMGTPLTLGVSGPADRMNEKCKREAIEALQQRLLYGIANIYFYEDRKVLEGKHFPMTELTILECYLERRDLENIRISIQKIFSENLMMKYGANYIRIMWVRILNMALHSFGSSENGGLEQILSGFGLVDEIATLEGLSVKLNTILLSCMKEEDLKDINAKNKIEMARFYMEENYNQNIIINELAERYDMSPNYFSSIFKKEMNQSAVNYLTNLRIKKAAEFLVNTEETVSDISRRVGYVDCQYFFRVFKRATGLTPLMYRKEHKQ